MLAGRDTRLLQLGDNLAGDKTLFNLDPVLHTGNF
jgi:hypothetical protein